MQQRLNVLTLGVDDVGRAGSFYEALGWEVTEADELLVTAITHRHEDRAA